MTKTSRPLTVTALLLAIFMGAMEATVVGTAMPTIVGELGGLAYYGWVGSAYLLASTVAVPCSVVGPRGLRHHVPPP